MDFVANGGLSPSILLAYKGYDVWLGNNRGNFFSYKSTNMTEKDPIYWQFDIEDIGTRDIPAMIDYIRDVTKW